MWRGVRIEVLRFTAGQRGLHDIEDQLVFASNPQFIFHDSRGFEAGGVDELEMVKAFIEKRAKMSRMADQLHAIWYVYTFNSCKRNMSRFPVTGIAYLLTVPDHN
jgi:hypothetical protein